MPHRDIPATSDRAKQTLRNIADRLRRLEQNSTSPGSVLIEAATLGDPQPQLVFQIPPQFKNLLVTFTVRSTSSSAKFLHAFANGDVTTHYFNAGIYAENGSAVAYAGPSETGWRCGFCAYAGAPLGRFGGGELILPNYAAVGQGNDLAWKSFGQDSTGLLGGSGGGSWEGTGLPGLFEIGFAPDVGSLDVGSQISCYGMW